MFPQRALDHFAVAAAAFQCVLHDLVSPRSGKIIDVGRHRIGEHEWQLGTRGFDLGLRLRLDVGIDRRGDLVGFVDRRGLGLLLGRRVVRLQGRQFRTVHAFQDSLQLVLHPLVRANLRRALQQLIHRVIKTALGRFQISGFELFLSALIVLLGVQNQISHRIGLGLGCGLALLFRVCIYLGYCLGNGRQDRGQSGRVGLGRRQARLTLVAVAGRAGQKQRRQQHNRKVGPSDSHFYLLLTYS